MRLLPYLGILLYGLKRI